GLYVQKGNPHNIQCFEDIAEKDIKMVNRERGAGARVLLDEKLKRLGLSASHISGYHNIVTTHLAAASAVSSGKADVGIGIENVARMSDVEFIPLIEEQYDLVLLKNERTKEIIASIKKILSSESFQQQLLSLKGYKTDQTGEILYESLL
ncbi:substrate-binding domain-containing protein, partial [Priestia filamentosa]